MCHLVFLSKIAPGVTSIRGFTDRFFLFLYTYNFSIKLLWGSSPSGVIPMVYLFPKFLRLSPPFVLRLTHSLFSIYIFTHFSLFYNVRLVSPPSRVTSMFFSSETVRGVTPIWGYRFTVSFLIYLYLLFLLLVSSFRG